MDDFVSLSSLNFFQLQTNCLRFEKTKEGFLPKSTLERYYLPDTTGLSGEDVFAQVALGWNSEGIGCTILVKEPFVEAHYPEIQKGNRVKLFLDTRDMKNTGFNTRFCHHFFFLPKEVDEVSRGEMTHFRTEDIHELCDPKELQLKSAFSTKEHTIQIFIPRQCLYGYDPEQFDRLGFTYRINRPKMPAQHFVVLSSEFQIDQQPSLWASLRLINGENSPK
jgi:hypothetical protein